MSQSVTQVEPARLPGLPPRFANNQDLLMYGAGVPGLSWVVPVGWSSDQPGLPTHMGLSSQL